VPKIGLLIRSAGDKYVMSDDERKTLLERLKASREEAERASRAVARQRIAEETRRAERHFAEGFSAHH